MNERALRVVLPILVLALVIACWHAVVRIFAIPPFVLPSPGLVLATLIADGPLLWQSLLVTLTLTVPSAIFTEAFLSFLGLGVQSPVASWGTMINDGVKAMSLYPWRLLFPAVLLSLTIFAFNVFGDGLRDAFDPKLKK